jgi:hypothetical protein
MIDKLTETGRSCSIQMNVENTQVMRISTHQFPVNLMIDQNLWRMRNLLDTYVAC